MTKIAIIGAGVVGMMTSIALAKKGISVDLFERGDLSFPDDQRAIAITKKSKHIMQEIGVWEGFEGLFSKMNDIYVVDNKSPRMLHLAKEDVGEELGYMIEMNDLKTKLKEAFDKEKLVNLSTETTVKVISNEYNNVEVEIKNKETAKCTYDLLLLCSGGKSEIREQFFVDRISKYYRQTVISFSVKHEKGHNGTAVEHFMPSGPFAILPHKDNYKSSIIWTEPSDLVAIYQNMPQDNFMEELESRFGPFLGKITMNSKLYFYPLSAKITQNYYNNRIVLVGDSAHVIHPLSGQGLNQGIKDVEAICNIIERNLSVGLDLNEQALREYENLRKHDNYLMYLVTDNINRIFSNNSPILRPVRRLGLSMLDKVPFIKKKLIKFASAVS